MNHLVLGCDFGELVVSIAIPFPNYRLDGWTFAARAVKVSGNF
jgi:hypothetical protein